MIKIAVQNATDEVLKGYGRLITREEKSGYDVGPYVWYGDVAASELANLSFGVVEVKGTGDYSVMSFERHLKTEEFWVSTNGDMIVVMGKPDAFAEEDILTLPELANFQPNSKPDQNALKAEDFIAVRVKSGCGLILEKGVWHVTPYAVDGPIDVITAFRAGTSSEDAYNGLPSLYGIAVQVEV